MHLRRWVVVSGMALTWVATVPAWSAESPAARAPATAAATDNSPAALIERAHAAQRRDADESRRLAEQALTALATTPDADLEFQARLELCDYYVERDAAATQVQIEAMQGLLPGLKRRGLRAGLLTCRGELREIQGAATEALTLYDQSVSTATSLNDDEMLAEALFSRGFLYSLQGEYAQSLADLRRSEALFTKIGQPLSAQTTRNGIASAYNRMGDFQQARAIYESSLQAQRSQGLLRDQVITEHNMGRASERMGDWVAARRSFETALRLSQAMNYSRGEAHALRGLAAADVATGNPREALRQLQRASLLNRDSYDARLAALIAVTEAMAMRALGEPARGRALLSSALETFRDAGAKGELVMVYEQLALVDSEMGEWRRAYQWQEAAKRTSEQILRSQIDQRFAAMKVEFDMATREKEYQALLRESVANQRALEQSGRARNLQYLVLGLIVLLAAMLATLAWQLNRNSQRMRRLALTDELTGVPNRRSVLALLTSVLQQPDGRTACALLLDIDHFKRINDTFGHATGDRVLQLVAQQLRNSLRPGEFFGRVGGEEFLIILPVGDLRTAHMRAENLRSQMTAIDIATIAPELSGLTASIGVAISRPGDSTRTLLQRADAALYRAKAAGRNRVQAESGPEQPLQPATWPPERPAAIK